MADEDPTHRLARSITEAARHLGDEKAELATKGDVASVHADVKQILERLAKGDTALALLEHRVQQLERIVFGMCSVVLLAVVGGLVALVIRS